MKNYAAKECLHYKSQSTDLKKKVENLTDSVSKGKGIVSVLVFLGSLVAAIIGYLNFK